MKTFTLSAIAVALTTAFAAPAFAADTSGLSPIQMVEYNAAVSDNDNIRANFILSQAGEDVTVSTSGKIGVPDFVIEQAEQDGDFARAAFLKDLNAGKIDSASPEAMARQAEVQAYEAANEELRGS